MSLLQTRNLDVSIAGLSVCRGLDLAIEPGDCWALLGRNGIGKSTLLNTLAGLRAADCGVVKLNGQDIHSLGRRQVARQLGMLFQHSDDHFPGTVLETALMGRHPHLGAFQWEGAEDIARAMQALTDMELASLTERNIQNLSGGERRRLDVATILTQEPSLYLLDEPVNHLDMHFQVNILQTFRALADNNKAVLMSLHDANLAARFCNKVIMMYGDGEIEAGDTSQLLNSTNLQRIYLHPVMEIRHQGINIYLAG